MKQQRKSVRSFSANHDKSLGTIKHILFKKSTRNVLGGTILRSTYTYSINGIPMKIKHISWITGVFFLSLAGCGSSKIPAPSSDLAAANQAIEQAKLVGAEEHAPLEIRAARQKIDRARQLISDKEHVQAKMIIEQAMLDAELAQVKSLSSKSQKAVNELHETIKTLKEEIQRTRGTDTIP